MEVFLNATIKFMEGIILWWLKSADSTTDFRAALENSSISSDWIPIEMLNSKMNFAANDNN